MSTLGGPKIVTDGLIMCLDAANTRSYPSTGNTWTDLSGKGNNGTLINGPTFNNLNNGSIVFDGINDYFTFPTVTFTNTPYTLEMFSKTTGVLDTSNRRSIFGYSFASEFSDVVTYFTNITVNSVNTYFNFNFSTAGAIVINQTFHWVFTLGADKTVMMYLNGKPISTPNTQLVGYTNIVSTFTRFGTWNGDRPFIGDLYTARIYNKALTDNEVLQNYNATKIRYNL